MGFFRVKRDGMWEPKLSDRPQPWFQRILCYVMGHDWIAKEWRKTGKAVFNPGFYPVHEYERAATCNRCHCKTWLQGQYHSGPFERYWREWHADEYRYDEEGWWPLDNDGNRLPLSDKPNRTGW